MDISKKIFCLFFVLALIATCAGAASNVARMDVESIPSSLAPGSDAFLKITLTNDGTTPFDSTAVQFYSIETPLRYADSYEWINLGGLGSGKSTSTLFKISVPDSTHSGVYKAKLLYRSCISSGCDEEEKFVLLPIQSPDALRLSVVNTTHLTKGQRETVYFRLDNTKNTRITRLKIAWSSNNDDIVPYNTGNQLDVTALDGNGSVTTSTEMMVKDTAKVGSTSVTFTGTYYDQTGTQHNASSVIGMYIADTQPFIKITGVRPEIMAPGEMNALDISVLNMAEFDVNSIMLKMSSSNNVLLPVGSVNVMYLEKLKPMESYTFSLPIVASRSVTAGSYPVTLSTTYYDNKNTLQTNEYTMGIIIGGQTMFDVSLQSTSQGQYSFYITNIGNNPALSAVVKIPEQPNYMTSGGASFIIGDMDVGEYTIVSFPQAQSTAADNRAQDMPGNRTTGGFNQSGLSPAQRRNQSFISGGLSSDALNVVVEYTDTTGARNTFSRPIPLRAFSSAGANATYPAGLARNRTTKEGDLLSTQNIVIASMVLVLAAGVFYYMKRRTGRKKQQVDSGTA